MAYFTKNNFTGGEITPEMYGRYDLIKYQNGLGCLKNSFVHVHGGISGRAGTRYISDFMDDHGGRLIPFTCHQNQSYVLCFGDGVLRFYTGGALVLNEDGKTPYEIKTPFKACDLQGLHYVQSHDVMIITHPSYPPQQLAMFGALDWCIVPIVFGSGLKPPQHITAKDNHKFEPVTLQYSYVVTSCSDTMHTESEPSYHCDVSLSLDSNGAWNVTLTWDAVKNAEYYTVYRYMDKYYCYVGHAASTTFTDNYIEPNAQKVPPKQVNPFDNNTGDAQDHYPRAAMFYNQRLFFAGTKANPQKIWGSKIDDYFNFDVSSPLMADDAVSFTVCSKKINTIKHFVNLGKLFFLTEESAWGLADNVIAGNALPHVQEINFVGAGDLEPLSVDNQVLFLDTLGQNIYEMTYDDTHGLSVRNVSLMASHLLKGHKIIDATYQRSPYFRCFFVRDDGVLIGLTYIKEQDVYAFYQYETQGKFESIATIKEGNQEQTYLIVQRPYKGGQKRFVEALASEYDGDDAHYCYLDNAVSFYDAGGGITSLKDLWHLDGQVVNALADGNVMLNLYIEDGGVKLPFSCRWVVVGLPYEACVSLLPFSDVDGGLAFCKKSYNRILLRVFNSRGLEVGLVKQNGDVIAFYEVKMLARALEGYDAPIALHTGIVEGGVPAYYDVDHVISLRQRYPLPFTILSLSCSILAADGEGA